VAHPVIPDTQEAEIRRIMVQNQPRQVVHKTLSQKYPSQKRGGGVGQGEGPEFKPWYHQKGYKTIRHDTTVELRCNFSTTVSENELFTPSASISYTEKWG
jgi:hypothetical protein